jgi:hypothetical protein
MVGGGLPEALLKQPGLYHRVFKGLLAQIEAEGASVPQDLAYHIAARWVEELPRTFHTEDIALLLRDLVLALATLRDEIPEHLPLDLINRWLESSRPEWGRSSPLRLSPGALEILIRPALQMERRTFVAAGRWRDVP